MSLNLKRHWRLLVLFVIVAALCAGALHYARVEGYIVQGKEETADKGVNYENSVDLLDSTVFHEVTILMSEEDQAKMLAAYQETGEKDFFETDILIDGVRVNRVGIRLKGNSSLRSAAGGGMAGGAPGFNLPNEAPPDGLQPPQGARPPAGAARPGRGQPAGGSGNLPYLVRFDAFVPGQCYQGLAEIALRTSGAGGDASLLQEPVSNAVLNEVGVPIARSVFGSVQLTGGEASLYTVAEHMDQTYLDRILPDSDGVLYKVIQVGNDFSYLGEDPALYADIFDQETAKGKADIMPLIEFIRFVNESSDEEFAAHLSEHLDVVAFADYLAVHNLLANSDSLAGMGNNYYLYYDFDTEKFTILSWDMNESLGKMAMGRGSSQMDIYWEGVGSMFGRGFGDAPGARGKHLLLQRFMAAREFRALYKERYQALYEQIYAGNLLTPKIDAFAALVTEYNAEHSIVDQAAFGAAVSEVRGFVAQRHEYLRSTEMAGE